MMSGKRRSVGGHDDVPIAIGATDTDYLTSDA